MALGRLSVKPGKVGRAGKHADYILRKNEYAKSMKRGELLEAVGFGNLPSWTRQNPSIFWRAADEFERSNGSSYREFECALPRELTPDQRKVLLDDFIKNELGETHAYTYAIHCPKAIDGKAQPHFHLMFSERRNDEIKRSREQYFKRYNSKSPERGGCKKGYGLRAGETLTAAERSAELQALRMRWQDICNEHLQRAERSERIDMRSYKDRGLNIEPEKHFGAKKWNVLKKDPLFQIEIKHTRAEREAAIFQLKSLPELFQNAMQIARDAVNTFRELISDPRAELLELQRAKEQRAADAAERAVFERRQQQGREYTRTGKITLTAAQEVVFKNFDSEQKQYLALREIYNAINRDLTAWQPYANTYNMAISRDHINRYLDGKEMSDKDLDATEQVIKASIEPYLKRLPVQKTEPEPQQNPVIQNAPQMSPGRSGRR